MTIECHQRSLASGGQYQNAVVVEADLPRVAGILPPALALKNELVFVVAGLQRHVRREAAGAVWPVRAVRNTVSGRRAGTVEHCPHCTGQSGGRERLA